MYTFKVQMCSREDNHDWARCPYAHEKEKARRRDPRKYKYASMPCPDTMQGRTCPRGDACTMTHSVQEYWLHPDRFKTQMCKNRSHCNRPLCFFAHRADELRFPEAGERVNSGASNLAADASLLSSEPCGSGAPLAPAPAAAAAAAAMATVSAAMLLSTQSTSQSGGCVLPILTEPAVVAPTATAVAAAAMNSAARAAALPGLLPVNFTDLSGDFMPQDLSPGPGALGGASAASAGMGMGGFAVPPAPAAAGLCRGVAPPTVLLPSAEPFSGLAFQALPAAAAEQPVPPMRAYLEQQHRAVAAQRSMLEQQRLALDLWLTHLQQQEAALSAGSAAAATAALSLPLSADEGPASPLCVAPRMPSNTSSVSQFNSGPFRMDLEPRGPMLTPITSMPISEAPAPHVPLAALAGALQLPLPDAWLPPASGAADPQLGFGVGGFGTQF